MGNHIRTGLLALQFSLFLAATGIPVAANDRPSSPISVRLLPGTLLENQDLKALVRVEKEPENRRLVVALDGPAFYSSTQRPLHGSSAASMHEFYFRALPAGSYLLSISVEDVSGAVRVTERRFDVHGTPAESTDTMARRP